VLLTAQEHRGAVASFDAELIRTAEALELTAVN